MNIQEILIIKNGSESYGISTSDINQIARVPMLMELPLRPSGVRGLCAISGNIVTMVDMNLLLDLEEVEIQNDNARLIVLHDEMAHATLLVSDVDNTLEIKEQNLEEVDKKDDPVVAIYKYNDTLIQIISLEVLFQKVSKVSIPAKDVRSNTKLTLEEESIEENEKRFLIFAMEDENYALHIDYLREIILADLEYTDVAGSADEVLGLITLRDELLIVIDLRTHYGFSSKDSYKNRILIASHKGKKIGLLVDEIIDIKSFKNEAIEYMKDTFEDNKISGVIHDEDSIVSFFDSNVLENLFEENKAYIEDENVEILTEDVVEAAMEVIVFMLSGKEYAFEVENVAEIIDIVESTSLAYTDDSMDGIINIRGQIVAIVSLFEKLNIEKTINPDSKIIICEIDNVKIGFVVDKVTDILEIKEADIREQDDELFSRVLYLNDGERLVLSMDIKEIIRQEEA